jgi:hypothetical protein
LSPSGFVFIHDETVHAEAQVRSQPALFRIEFVEEFAFEKFDKKSLREILRGIRRAVPSQAHIFVDGLPVRRAQRFQRLLAFFGIDAAHRFEDGSTSCGEAVAACWKVFLGHFMAYSNEAA